IVQQTTNVYVTDESGECRLPLDRRDPPGDWEFYVEILKDGYTLQFANWSSSRGDAVKDIPMEYTARLAWAAAIEGIVVNEQGEPISDARVLVTTEASQGGFQIEPLGSEGFVTGNDYHSEFTDAQGRWRCSHLPRDFQPIALKIIHPDYTAASL